MKSTKSEVCFLSEVCTVPSFSFIFFVIFYDI